MKRIAVLIGTLLLLVGGVAYASIPSPDGTISGCYNNANGSLKVIDTEAGASCSGNETALNWDQPEVPIGDQLTLRVFDDMGPIPAQSFGTAFAQCPSGTVVVAGGFSDNGWSSIYDVDISSSAPNSQNSGWVVQIYNHETIEVPGGGAIATCAPN